MKIPGRKNSAALVPILLGTAIGALSGHFVWILITPLGAWALWYVVQNLSLILPYHDANEETTRAPDVKSSSLGSNGRWLEKWNEEMDYCPTYKGTPGNIWRGANRTNDD